ncbi:MAG: hypothetical protein QOE86_91 [Solirubrobacteraceae bacterium]|nr:hypothetical protein [Solirubrobacteraceae bacterium]
MPIRTARLAGLMASGAAFMALFAAGPASAAVTTSQITSPASPFFTYYDNDSSDPQTFTVSGTSNGTDTDMVDIRCYYDDGNFDPLYTDLAVAADGSFSATVGKPSERSCVLRAVPSAGWNNLLNNYAGPVSGFGLNETYLNSASQPYDYRVVSSTRKAQNYFYSASDCGLDYNYLYGPDFRLSDGTWDCNAGLYSYDGGYKNTSEIVVDGHSAFTPSGAYYAYTYGSSGSAGAPAADIKRSFNAATGEWTITETDPLAYCANVDGSINDTPDSGWPYWTCDHWVAAPAQLVRTITESHEGLLVTIADRWSSTDGGSHTLHALYDNYQNGNTAQAPGESGFTIHGEGTVSDLGSSAVGTLYFQYDSSYPAGIDNTQGAMTYTTAPNEAVWESPTELLLDYERTIPATGSLAIDHHYASGFSREAVQGLASGVEDANGAPAVAITSPSSGAVVTSDAVTVVGSASDNVGVSSLTVNGIPTAVNGDGSWSQRVPLSPGANTITAVAKDASGNSSQAQVPVTYSPPSAPSCTVPNVVGKGSAAAATAVGASGCTVGVTTSKPSKAAKGTVVSQSRKAGGTLPAYFPLDLVVSSGPVGKAKVVTKTAKVKSGKVTIQLSCPKTSGNVCNGTVKLRTTSKLAGAKRTLGTKAFQTPAGKKRNTTFSLSKADQRRLKGKSVKVTAYVVYRDENGTSRTTTAKLTIKG